MKELRWCNGNITAFQAVVRGSIPRRSRLVQTFTIRKLKTCDPSRPPPGTSSVDPQGDVLWALWVANQINHVLISMKMTAQSYLSALRTKTRVKSTLALTAGSGLDSSEARTSLRTAVEGQDELSIERYAQRELLLIHRHK